MSRPPNICDLPRQPEMPLRLKAILARINTSYAEFGRAITQTRGYCEGRPLSETAVRHMVAHNKWPSLTPRHEIREQTERFLSERGLTPADIEAAFDVVDEEPIPTPPEPIAPPPPFDPIETEMLSAAARKQFGIFRDPFSDDVQGPDDVFLSPDQRYIREVLLTSARHGGFVAVVGESGSGKSTLRRDLIDRIAREQLPLILIQPRVIDKGAMNARAICHAIIDDIAPGRRVPNTMEAVSRLAEKLLTESSRAGNSHALLIEEAHDLNISTLKFLKRFWELEDGFKRLLSIVLIGQPELKDKLDERRNYDAREVIRRCEVAELLPLDRELESYIGLKFKRIGLDAGALFDPAAYDAMRTRLTRAGKTPREAISMVYPLLVNGLVTRALNAAAELGEPRVSADLIKEL